MSTGMSMSCKREALRGAHSFKKV